MKREKPKAYMKPAYSSRQTTRNKVFNLIIQGTRGIPASHGGFETFAETLSIYLVNQGWDVIVYCQEPWAGVSEISESQWRGVRRIHIPVKGTGAKATVIFDYLSVKHACRQAGLILTLGYNTALFNLFFRFKGKKILLTWMVLSGAGGNGLGMKEFGSI